MSVTMCVSTQDFLPDVGALSGGRDVRGGLHALGVDDAGRRVGMRPSWMRTGVAEGR